jgi:hypothetical protein
MEKNRWFRVAPNFHSERRNHERFKLRNNVIATLRPGSVKVGHITNISRTGISFSYYHNKKPTIEAAEMDILLPDFIKGFFLQKLAIKTVWDIFLSNSKHLDSSSNRKRGLAFQKLDQNQLSDLELFIRSYSV